MPSERYYRNDPGLRQRRSKESPMALPGRPKSFDPGVVYESKRMPSEQPRSLRPPTTSHASRTMGAAGDYTSAGASSLRRIRAYEPAEGGRRHGSRGKRK